MENKVKETEKEKKAYRKHKKCIHWAFFQQPFNQRDSLYNEIIEKITKSRKESNKKKQQQTNRKGPTTEIIWNRNKNIKHK